MKDEQLKDFLQRIQVPIFFVVSLWVIHAIKVVFDANFEQYGIMPHTIDGLRGIFLAPLIHSNWEHLAANSAPMLVTTVLLMVFYPSIAFRAFVMIYLLTGLMVWTLPMRIDSLHIGASGVVFGLVSFLFWTGVFRRSSKSVFLALGILVLYGSIFEGVVPKDPRVSWESHLFGAIIGIVVAYYFKENLENDELKTNKWQHIPRHERPFFLPRDTFQFTKLQRQQIEEERIRAEREERYRLYQEQQQGLNTWNIDHT
jgi:membrane associated rhomboid family serine protease